MKNLTRTIQINDLVLLKYGAIGTKLARVAKRAKDGKRLKVQLLYAPDSKSKGLIPSAKHLQFRNEEDVIWNFGTTYFLDNCRSMIERVLRYKTVKKNWKKQNKKIIAYVPWS
jgi:hypothetical protein